MKFKKYFIFLWTLYFGAPTWAQQVSDYNIKWTDPGIDSQGSIPIGNGDIGANVWVEKNGDLVFYVSKSDAWSEIGRLLKLGRIRISFGFDSSNQQTFVQELKLQNGEIVIRYGHSEVRFWIDANHPVIQVDVAAEKPVQVKVTYESWRKMRRAITGLENRSVWGIGGNQVSKDCPTDIWQDPDTILDRNKNAIMAFHHNSYSIWDQDMAVQSLSGFKTATDPLVNRNYGVLVEGSNLISISDTALASEKPSRHFQIQVFPLTQTGSISSWVKQVRTQASAVKKIPVETRWAAHSKWWNGFWDRSYIYITSKDASEQNVAETVTRGYILQRYLNACAGRGKYPIKFNGSIFTVDTYNRKGDYSGLDADFRLWGGCYWWQNTRLPYWSMLESGDFDLMSQLFEMYMKALPLRVYATKNYYHHDGAFFPETMNFWGTYAGSDYGCQRDGLPDGYTKNPYVRYYWQSGLELALMMEDYYSFTKRKTFATDTLVPFVSQVLTFYDQHWKRGEDGKILFDPAHSLETYHKAVNPLPEIAGTKAVAKKMLMLPETLTSAILRVQWKKLIDDLPEIPLRRVKSDTLLAPADSYCNEANTENPELYAVFPYRNYMSGKVHRNWALNAYKLRKHKENDGWQQSAIQAAYLGLTEDAKKMVVERFSTWDKNFRFPAFWGPNYDWTPDQDHGNVAMITLQRMLVTYEDEKIMLLPAWPKGWDVHFKLSIPGRKTVQGIYRDGKLAEMRSIVK